MLNILCMKCSIKSIPGHNDQNTAYYVVTLRIKTKLSRKFCNIIQNIKNSFMKYLLQQSVATNSLSHSGQDEGDSSECSALYSQSLKMW